MVSRENSQKSVESPVHQQDKDSSAGGGEGWVEGLSNLYWKMRDCESSKELSEKDIVSEDDDGLSEGGVIMVESRGDDPFVEDGVGEDIDQNDLSLDDREAEEVEWDFVGRSVQNQGHGGMGRSML